VRAAQSRQEIAQVFTLTGPTFIGIPGGASLRDRGFSREEEGVWTPIEPPLPPPPSEPPEDPSIMISTD
jgi:hypothetical protein